MSVYPSGRWIVYRDADYWVVVHTTKLGCFAQADLWEELPDRMLEAERVWDETMTDGQSY